MKIGLFFGSFNPMHIGHKAIASYMVELTDLEKVCFIVSPQNPLKQKQTLLDQHHRLMIIRMETEDNPTLEVSDIEFKLDKPNYTIDTINRLSEDFPNKQFTLLIGEDNLANFHYWKDYSKILELVEVFVYPRNTTINVDNALINNKKIKILDAPKIAISSEEIRKKMKEGVDIKGYLPKVVYEYIIEKRLFN